MQKKFKKTVLKMGLANMQDFGVHIFVTIKINGKPARMVVDTGCTCTILEDSVRRKFALGKLGLKHDLSAGIGSSNVSTSVYRIKKIEFGKIRVTNVPLSTISLAHINSIYEKFHLPKADGILGNDLLFTLKGNIDFNEKLLKLESCNIDFSHIEIKIPDLPKQ